MSSSLEPMIKWSKISKMTSPLSFVEIVIVGLDMAASWCHTLWKITFPVEKKSFLSDKNTPRMPADLDLDKGWKKLTVWYLICVNWFTVF